MRWRSLTSRIIHNKRHAAPRIDIGSLNCPQQPHDIALKEVARELAHPALVNNAGAAQPALFDQEAHVSAVANPAEVSIARRDVAEIVGIGERSEHRGWQICLGKSFGHIDPILRTPLASECQETEQQHDGAPFARRVDAPKHSARTDGDGQAKQCRKHADGNNAEVITEQTKRIHDAAEHDQQTEQRCGSALSGLKES